MASIYLTSVTGDGSTTATALRPSGFDGRPFSVLMMSEVKGKALLLSSDDTVTGVGVNNLITAASVQTLRTFAQSNNPSAAKRTAISSWLSSAGWNPLSLAQVTWWDCLHFAARQGNPAADLGVTGV